MRFAACLRVVQEGGEVAAVENRLLVTGAHAFTAYIATATGFRGFDQPPDLSAAQVNAAARGRARRGRKPGLFGHSRGPHCRSPEAVPPRIASINGGRSRCTAHCGTSENSR